MDEEQVILYGPFPYDEGEELGFAILLADGTPALQGVGRVRAAVDGGEERPPEARYDIVVDSLSFEARAEVVYERILLARGGGDPTGEVRVDDIENEADPYGESTVVAHSDDVGGYAPPEGPGAEWEDAAMAGDAEPDGAEADAAGYFDEAGTGGYGAQDAGADAAAHGDGAHEAEAHRTGSSTFEEEPAEASAHEPMGEAMPVGDEQYEQNVMAAFDHGEPAASADDMPWGGEDPSTGEVHIGDLEAAEVDMDEVEPVPGPAGRYHSRPPTAPPPQPPSAPSGFALASMGTNGATLTRPSMAASWYPEAVPAMEPRPSSGLFQYGGGLPVPTRSPRPDLDPSMRIRPAPRPGSEAAVAAQEGGAAVDMDGVAPGLPEAFEPDVAEVEASDVSFDPSYSEPPAEVVAGELRSSTWPPAARTRRARSTCRASRGTTRDTSRLPPRSSCPTTRTTRTSVSRGR